MTSPSPNVSPKVAFIGLGAIGTPMAQHVAKHFSLSVWNRTQSKAESFGNEFGTAVASSPADAAKDADFVITCLPSSNEVEDVVFGPNGLEGAMKSGSVLIDCTSGDPAASRRMADRLKAKGIAFIDAPVSGGVVGAQTAQLTVMCGGEPELFERVKPILETFGAKIVLCGTIGCGHALKAVNNALLALHIWSTAEGLVMLEKLGVNPTLALDVINASSGRSNASMNLFPERVLNRSFPNTFRLALLDKDVRIAAKIADDTRTHAETIALTAKLFSQAHRSLGNQADHVEAVKYVEQRSGVEIRGR